MWKLSKGKKKKNMQLHIQINALAKDEALNLQVKTKQNKTSVSIFINTLMFVSYSKLVHFQKRTHKPKNQGT